MKNIKNNPILKLKIKAKSQNGFTLIEMIVAIAIAAIIAGGLVSVTMQMYSTNASTSNDAIAIQQVQNAVYYIRNDALQAQAQGGTVTGSGSNLQFIIPNTTDGINFTYPQVQYIWDSSTGTLERNGKTIATNIPSGGFNVDSSDYPPLYVTITSTVTGLRPASETRTVLLEK